MSSLTLSLLGPPRIGRDGAPVHVPRHKAVALLVYLAVTGQTHRRDTLAMLLWPEHDQSRARAGLRRALAALKGALGEGWLDAERETIGLNRDAEIVLDVRAFRERLAACRGHDHPPQEVCPTCLTLLGEAAALHGGDFLAGFTLRDSPAFDDWQFFEAQGLRDELAGALERLVVGHSARGEFEPAIAYARRWLALDPLHEAAQRRLMELYAWSGQRAAALRQYEECERVLREELGAPPEEETVALHQAIVEQRELPFPVERISPAASQALPRRHNLPAQLIPFVGREALLAEIGQRLEDPGCRLLSLIGPGGSGKTRLALEAAARRIDQYLDGVFFVSLAPLDAVEGIVPAVAQALGFSFHGEGEPKEQLLNYLREKSMLLVLGNYEHLLDGATMAIEILEAAPGVVIVATSRARLNVSGEQLHPIPGMDLPRPGADSTLTPQDVARYSALKLFAAGARRVRPGFVLTQDNLVDVVRICRLVEGMPLGILLAAAWMELLTPAEIGAEIEGQMTGSGLDFLETEWRDVPARQRSMRAVFDHSWDLLTEREREVLSGLSVFRGGFTRGTAERVVGASLRELTALVHKSLLHRSPGGRYEVHELVRQYAAGKLAASPDAEQRVRDRHCATYTAALQRWDAEFKGPRQLTALAEVEAEIGNARAAWEWAVERGQVQELDRAMDGQCRFYEWRGRYEEGDAACRAAADALAPGAGAGSALPERRRDGVSVAEGVRARAVAWRGAFHRALGRLERAKRLLEESLALLEALAFASREVRRERAFALWQLGYTLYDLGNSEAARQRYEESLAFYRALGERWQMASLSYHLGDLLQVSGAPEEAEVLVREGLAIQQNLGDRRGIAGSLRVLSMIIGATGPLEESERFVQESVAIFQAMDDRAHAAEALIDWGWVLMSLGDLTRARSRCEESVALYRDLGFSGSSSSFSLGALCLVEVLLGRYKEARASGQAALAMAQERAYRLGVGISLWGLSQVAIAEGEYAQAQQLARQACSTLEGSVFYYLAFDKLAYAARGLSQLGQARRHICELLRAGVPWLLLAALPPIALLLADRGEAERAVELYALASRYPNVANAQWYEDVAGKQIAAVAATLPPDVVAAAQERGRARDLEATVKELLAELGDP